MIEFYTTEIPRDEGGDERNPTMEYRYAKDTATGKTVHILAFKHEPEEELRRMMADQLTDPSKPSRYLGGLLHAIARNNIPARRAADA